MAKEVSRTFKIFPSNYADIFPGASLDPGKFLVNNFIWVTPFTAPTIDYMATDTREAFTPGSMADTTYCFYYPKNTIREEVVHTYAPAEGALMDMIKSGKQALLDVHRTGRTLKEAGLNAISGNLSKAFSTKIGLLFEEPTFFTNTEKRRFDITLDLYKLNETDDFYEAISFFKRHSHATPTGKQTLDVNVPLIGQISAGFASFTFPSTFVLSGSLFNSFAVMPKTLNKRHLILKSMSIEYNSNAFSFLDPETGLPVAATMVLSFEEAQSLNSTDWGIGSGFTPEILEKGTR